jgi:excisionase family DNA binding protein
MARIEKSTPQNRRKTGKWQRAMITAKQKVEKAPSIGDKLLTLREAAEVLRLNPRTVREYVQRGEIEGRIIGGRWRFRRADLDTFFENAPRNWDFVGKNNHGD